MPHVRSTPRSARVETHWLLDSGVLRSQGDRTALPFFAADLPLWILEGKQMARQDKRRVDKRKFNLETKVSSQRKPGRLLDKAEAAAYLNTSERHIQRLWAERRITGVKVGRKVRFRIDDLDAWIEAHTVREVDR